MSAATDTVSDLAWAEAQFGGPPCEVTDMRDGPAGRETGLRCDIPATCRLVIVHASRPDDPDEADELAACDHHREAVQAAAGPSGVIGRCPGCGDARLLARVEPL